MAPVRAAAWFNSISRLGIHPPFFIVHDLGLLFTAPQGAAGWTIAPNAAALAQIAPPPPVRNMLREYTDLLHHIASSDVVEKVAGWRSSQA